MHVRLATADDQPAIERVHERSIREIAGEHYRDAVIEVWAGSDDDGDEAAEDIEDDADAEERRDLDSDEPHEEAQPVNGRLFVAEVEQNTSGDGSPDDIAIAGFVDVRFDPPQYLAEPTDGGVRAVYVDPAYASEGVGSALLERLEATAREQGFDSLGLHSSVNARAFYELHGYEVVEEITFEFGDEVEGPAIEMQKDL